MEYTERKRWVFFGLPFTFTKYVVKEDMITIDEGLLKTIENDCFMYKVQDVTHTASLAEKLFGLGTVTCYTAFQRVEGIHPEAVRGGQAEETHGKYAGYRLRRHGGYGGRRRLRLCGNPGCPEQLGWYTA